MPPVTDTVAADPEFWLMVRRALLSVIRLIEKRLRIPVEQIIGTPDDELMLSAGAVLRQYEYVYSDHSNCHCSLCDLNNALLRVQQRK